jgi:MFS family permease
MEKKTLRLGSVILQKEFQAMFVLIFNSFSWYFPLFFFLTDTVEKMTLGYMQSLIVFGLHYTAIAVFAFLGNLLADRYGRNRLLSLWILIGIGASASMLLLNPAQEGMLYFISFFLGISLGLGFPSCLAFFADHLVVESRGLFGGVTFAITFLGITLVGLVTTLTDFTTSVLVFALWRLIGLLLFLNLKPEEKINQEKVRAQKKISYFRIFRQKSFILYIIPWVMFCLINFFEVPFFDTQLQQHYLGTDLSYIISIGEFGIGGISAIVGGYFSDIIGRKRLIIIAYIMVGIGYAVLSLSFMTPLVFYVYVLLDGIAWGIFMLMFFLIIWGDLAEEHLKNRYYLIGNLPFILSTFIPTIVKPYSEAVPLFTAFSLASFFLFLAVIPLIYAPETLSEKNIKERELKSYLEKAKKTKEKYA